MRFVVFVTRPDGSTAFKGDLPLGRAQALTQRLFALLLPTNDVTQVYIARHEPGVEYASRGPMLPLPAALKWKQPDDLVTQILEEA